MEAAQDKYQRLALRGAWRRFEVFGGGRTGDLENRLRALEVKVRDLNLERDAVHLAAELAALEPNLEDDARFALIVLTILTLAALAQGSTRFPVTGESSREPMHHMLGALIGTDAAASEKIRRSIEDLLLNQRVAKVISRTELDRLVGWQAVFHLEIGDGLVELRQRRVDLVAQLTRCLGKANCGIPCEAFALHGLHPEAIAVARLVQPAGNGGPDEGNIRLALLQRFHAFFRRQNGDLLDVILLGQEVLRRRLILNRDALAQPGFRERMEGMTPLRRIGAPEEIAEAAAWLI